MTPTLRPSQIPLREGIARAWADGHATVMGVLPTGGGKTVIMADVVDAETTPVCCIAHRQELVEQISLALTRCGVRHRIIAPQKTVRQIVTAQMEETGRNCYSPSANVAVAGVDTLVRASDGLKAWIKTCGLWVIDEGHHLLEGNKWGRAVDLFAPTCRGLALTATPVRADGKGLGRTSDGVTDVLVGPDGSIGAEIHGAPMRELIDDGWLTDYRVIAPPSDIDLSDVTVGATGDYNPQKLKKAVRQSHIIGDVVGHYQKWTPGRLAVVFASDVETSGDIAARFNTAGVRAESVSAKTESRVRRSILRQFRAGQIRVLVNVDLFGEGFDLPAIEVAIFARPTESYSLYCQQFGRALRLMLDAPPPADRAGRLAAIQASRKPRATIIDHVGNVVRHGLPDAPRTFTLAPREKRSRSKPDDAIPLRECLNVACMAVYERVHPVCPYCQHKPEPAARTAPEFVDGDLTELDADTLAKMRGDVARVDQPIEAFAAEQARKGAPRVAQLANVKRHRERQEAQRALREVVAWWAGYQRAAGRTDAEAYRRFYYRFGIDVLSAQALGRRDALELADRVALAIATDER